MSRTRKILDANREGLPLRFNGHTQEGSLVGGFRAGFLERANHMSGGLLI